MSLTALVEGRPSLALDGNVIRALCRDPRCGADMHRRASKGVVPHWVHNPGTADRCPHPHETSEWHLSWQFRCTDAERIEATVGSRRADVLSKFGWAVEFQHSNIKTSDLHAREDDWRGQLIWVQDATGATHGDLEIQPGGEFQWISPPTRIGAARCHQIVDPGGDRLLWLPGGTPLPAGGRDIERVGRLLSVKDFVDTWLNGLTPRFPKGWERSRWSYEQVNPRAQRKAPEPRSARLATALSDAQDGMDAYRCDRAPEGVVPLAAGGCEAPTRDGSLCLIQGTWLSPSGRTFCSRHSPSRERSA